MRYATVRDVEKAFRRDVRTTIIVVTTLIILFLVALLW